MRKFLILFFTSNLVIADQWSNFITTERKNDVSFSFRQLLASDNSWSIQWQVNNDRETWVEPIILKRKYICDNNQSHERGEVSFGVYLPKIKQTSEIIDDNICPNSRLTLIEIKTEIRLPKK